jgi:ABC-type bacteriocin/lantibiotic exporter with double-glycine peptidase domain
MRMSRRGLLVPEVVQTSAMDCGPASLKCLLEGFGISVSYGRLREACQTDVDGTSIDTLEEIAMQLGFAAEQIMVPPDYVLLEEAEALPAIVVVSLPQGLTHFVVAWKRHGNIVQVMDPRTGRRWPTCDQFLSTLYVHTQLADVSAWREWAASDKFQRPLHRKFADLGLSTSDATRLAESAAADSGWRSLAALEASTRTVEATVRSGGLHRGAEAARAVERLFEGARGADEQQTVVPANYWSLRAAASGAAGEEQILFSGAVLVHAIGPCRQSRSSVGRQAQPLSPELTAALAEPPARPGLELVRLLREDGRKAPFALVGALLLAAAGVMIEAILFRSLLDLAHELGLSSQRLMAMGALVLLVTVLLGLDFSIAAGVLRMGRCLESRLRIAFLKKIPRLGDRYFHSRLNSDMAARSHTIHRIRILPNLGGRFLRSTFELVLTAAGIVWLDPRNAAIAIIAAVLALSLPLLVQPLLSERDMRLQNHAGALSRYYLDAFLGLVPLRTHRAEVALRREHGSLLAEWARAGFGLQRVIVAFEGLQFLAGFGLAAWLVIDHVSRVSELGSVLLLVYWALNLPMLGQDIAQVAWQYPAYRNLTLRLLELLGAPEDAEFESPRASCAAPIKTEVVARKNPAAVSIAFNSVRIRASGHTILDDVDVKIEAGSHVAIVGPSGAGKSSLVGILLGWHRPANGCVLVDGVPLDGNYLERLRLETAWIDPAVQIWNRSLFDNLRYGSADSIPTPELLEESELHELLQKLPDGLQTELGENGALVSGGEGQRVRLGRAMLKPNVRLAILDEPLRGLDRQRRRVLLERSRKHWRYATLLCVTHDVGETLSFPRVLVVEAGRIVEDGAPQDLAERPHSRYRAMLQAEKDVCDRMWSSSDWKHMRLEGGRLIPKMAQKRAGA